MNTFKHYVFRHRSKIPSIETIFGSHSEKKSDKPTSIKTSLGTHSTKGDISEKVTLSDGIKKNMLTAAEETAMHKTVAPLHESLMHDHEREAVEDYSDESQPYNQLLHRHDTGHSINTSNSSSYKKTVGHLDTLLEKHKTTKDMHVFTGIKFSPAKHFKRIDGEVPASVKLHMPAFTSTSSSLGVAREFSEETNHPNDNRHGVDSEEGDRRHVLKIHVPAGSHAMSLKKYSFVPAEKEILLHRGHTIEVHHTPEKIDHNTYLWHARIVGHEKADLSKDKE